MIKSLGESGVNKILSSFSSPKSPDTEEYIKDRAIEDAKRGITQTHIVLAERNNNWIFVGYFTVMPKTLFIEANIPTINTKKTILSLATFDSDRNGYKVPATLIAQFSKNFSNNANRYISGDELMDICLGTIKDAQMLIGGCVVYLECENIYTLKNLYKRNGFIRFTSRPHEEGEKRTGSGDKMIQMLRIIE